jgi:hypothetical protein
MKQLGQSAVGTGAGTTLYTVPTCYKTEVRDILIANTSAASISLSFHFVASGGSASTSNAIFSSVSIPANTTLHWSGIQILSAGQFIKAIGSASGITMTISGDEVRVGL